MQWSQLLVYSKGFSTFVSNLILSVTFCLSYVIRHSFLGVFSLTKTLVSSGSMYRAYLQVMPFRILVENRFDPGSWRKGSRVVKGVTSFCDNGSRWLSFA